MSIKGSFDEERRRILARAAALGGLAAGGWALPARAQALPAMARMLVGYPPGSSPDVVARRLADRLVGRLATAVVVENKVGAGGRIAVDAARQAAPDGTTLLLCPSSILTINPHVFRKLSYQPFEDLTPISLAAKFHFAFAVGPSVPPEVATLAQFAAWAKGERATYGSPGLGTPSHVIGHAISERFGLSMTHVPYRGSAQAISDMTGGQLTSFVFTEGDLRPYQKTFRALATTGQQRSAMNPGVMTLLENGITGLEQPDWFGVYMGGKPSSTVLSHVSAQVRAALASPQYVQAIAESGWEPVSSSPTELDRQARIDLERWGPLVRATGFQTD